VVSSRVSFKQQAAGFTLIELLVSAALLAVILIAAERAINVAQRSAEVSETTTETLRDLDRFLVLLESDLRNVLPVGKAIPQFGPLPAMSLQPTDDYILLFLRAGQANPLLLPRTEVLRVGYRLEDNVLWRDSWIDPWMPEPDRARPQQLLDQVEEIEFRALPRPPAARSVSEGPWQETWPAGNPISSDLPLAIELRLKLKRRGEITRLVPLLQG
jgi:general secretion pathway protein J